MAPRMKHPGSSKGNKVTDPSRVEAALEYHRGTMIPAGAGSARPGKIEIVPSKSLVTQRDLSIAYSPGVAEPCREIAKNPEAVYDYTAKGNLVGVVTNGTAVLGLGDIGPLASKPVMEGKAVLFKKFADIDCFDIELKTNSVDAFVEAAAALEPTFGGINLEDIKAPECFEIERRLRERMDIPVFHDDQHGTAIISGAALLNALEITGRKIEDIRVVHCGGGAASISCARFWLSLGVRRENCVMTDRFGVLIEGRAEEINPHQAEFMIRQGESRWHAKTPASVAEALQGADVFMGCSVGNILAPEALKAMNDRPIVFAMANPDPEIPYDAAIASRPDLLFATGRSDYPNQVNNVLGYPFIFRGALDVRARTINEEMKIAAARAIAQLAKQDVPESVIQAYGGGALRFGPKYILPKPFDPRALLWVAPAVAEAAIRTGVARHGFPGGSFITYQSRLEKLLGKSRSVMRDLRGRIESSDAPGFRKIRVVLPEGTHEKVLKAAAELVAQGIAEPIILGDPVDVRPLIAKLGLSELENVPVIRPSRHPLHQTFADNFWELRKRKGATPDSSYQLIKDPLYFGAMLVREGYADAWLSGATRAYPETIRPALQVVGSAGGTRLAGVYMLVWKDRVMFLADTTVNIEPTATDLADIAIHSARVAESLGFTPRVGMLSFSSFGSNAHPRVKAVQEAVEIVRRRWPDLIIDGEIQADAAVTPAIMQERYPFCAFKDEGANVLVFPDLASANVSYKLLSRLGGAEAVGPILVGMNQPIHVLQMNSDVSEIVNMGIIAVLDAQRRQAHRQPLKTIPPN
jgi:malate dehydrogenase (oxaloacetate-decarboxylating)(NADP+)